MGVLYTAYIVTLVFGVASASSREKREDCSQEFATYSSCMTAARSSFSVTPDGKPNAVERMGCNVIEALQTCNSKVSSTCHTAEVKAQMNQQIQNILDNLLTMPAWDTDKCPAAKSFLANGGTVGLMLSISLVAIAVVSILA